MTHQGTETSLQLLLWVRVQTEGSYIFPHLGARMVRPTGVKGQGEDSCIREGWSW